VRELQGRTEEAERLFRETLEARRRVLGENHEATLWSKYRLALLYSDQGRHDEAERFHREALAGRRLTLGDDDEETIRSMNSLAWVLLKREPPAARDAEAALPIALEANERTDFQDPGYLDTLALAYHLTDNVEKAIDTQKKAISLVPAANAELREELARRLGEFEKATEDTLR
jgi:tetratricopeptide (TPR) repeat protein